MPRRKQKKEMSFIPCLTCAQVFINFQQLEQHRNDTYHYKYPSDVSSKKQALYVYLDAFRHEEVVIAKKDRRNARKTVQDVIGDVMWHVIEQTDGEVYSKKLITAGSTSTQTKVGKADEFDFNIEMKVPLETIKTDGVISFDFQKDYLHHTPWHPSGRTALADHKKVVQSHEFTPIPSGYCVAILQNHIKSDALVDLSYKNCLIPRHVQEDLYAKLSLAIQSRDKRKELDIHLQRFPNGPAVTMIIKGKHEHDISVDFAASIDLKDKLNKAVSTHGWPRNKTKNVLSNDKINQILAAGVHLVPKKDMFWYISYSHPAKVLLNNIDAWDECRRKCHKIMKRDFQIWKSQSPHGFEGISTYIFKHHLFWMNELHYKEKDYWQDENIGQCYIDMLEDASDCLEKHQLFNYFNHNENILQYKKSIILLDLARCMRERRKRLLRIKLHKSQDLYNDIQNIDTK